MQNEIGLLCFLYSRPERRHQMVRQLPDESHRVGHAEAVAFADIHFTRERVDRGEQPVFDEDIGARQRFEQTRLPGVGVADERRRRDVAPALPQIGAVFGDLFQPPLEHRDLVANHSAVGFELRLAGPAQSDTAANTRQVGPHAREPRQQVLELRELDLELGFVAARARREDVEDDLGAVHDAHAETLFELDALHRRERFVEQDQRRAGGGQLALQRFDLALAEIEVGSGSVDPLDGPADDLRPGGIGEPLELLQMFIDVHRVVRAFSGCPNEIGSLDRVLNFDKLTNTSSPSDQGCKLEASSLKPLCNLASCTTLRA